MTNGRPKPLFVVGNKRSGSTLFVNILNSHNDVFVTHESDIVWILFQLCSHEEGPLLPYAYDDAKGMRMTLETFDPLLQRPDREVDKAAFAADRFYTVLEKIRKNGRGGWDRPKNGERVLWIGDKKPVQQCDPEIQVFMREVFPDAMYLHLIRHPRSVVASMMKAAKKWSKVSVPTYWAGTASDVLDQWVTHEKWVLDMKIKMPNAVHTIRLEDLAADPVTTLERIFSVLDLAAPTDVKSWVRKWVWSTPNQYYDTFDLPASNEADRIMETYGYSRD